jgi:tetratricopeptide (TPR) repeat protein
MGEVGDAKGAAPHDARARALADLEGAIATLEGEPGSAAAWRRLGRLLSALGRYDDALEAVDRALALDETRAAGWRLKGNILLKLGQLAEARAAFRQAVALALGSRRAIRRGAIRRSAIRRSANEADRPRKWWQLNRDVVDLLEGLAAVLELLANIFVRH